MNPEDFDAQAVAQYDLKREFRRKCTLQYATEQMAAIREVLTWLKSHRKS